MMNRRHLYRSAALVGALLVLSACAAGPNDVVSADGTQLAGFWLGLWHGFIVPVTFVVSLFTDTVSIYEVHNTGGWYDLGFVLGVSSVFSGAGGSSAAGRRRRSR